MIGTIHRYVGTSHPSLRGKLVVMATAGGNPTTPLGRFIRPLVFLIEGEVAERRLSRCAYEVKATDITPTGASWPGESLPTPLAVIFADRPEDSPS